MGLLCVILLSSTATVPNGAEGASENVSMSICEQFPGTQKQKQIKAFNRRGEKRQFCRREKNLSGSMSAGGGRS